MSAESREAGGRRPSTVDPLEARVAVLERVAFSLLERLAQAEAMLEEIAPDEGGAHEDDPLLAPEPPRRPALRLVVNNIVSRAGLG